jgi:hypothetical protein
MKEVNNLPFPASAEQTRRRAPIKRIVTGLFLSSLLLTYLFQPVWQQLPSLTLPSCLHGHKTIDQRVKSILTRTPLIGSYITLSHTHSPH